MQAWKVAAACAAMGISAGCASLPDAQVNYFLPKADVVVRVDRHVTCKDRNVVMRPTAEVFTTYSADAARGQRQLDLRRLDRWYATSELAIALTPDGRLASINATNKGDGETWAKTAASLVGLAVNLGALPAPIKLPPGVAAAMAPESEDDKARRLLCDRVEKAKDGVAVFSYEARLDFHDPLQGNPTPGEPLAPLSYPKAWVPKPVDNDYAAHKALDVLTGEMRVSAIPRTKDVSAGPVTNCNNASAACTRNPVVHARMPVHYDVLLLANFTERPLGLVSVPQAGPEYALPLPAPRVFGKQTAGVTFAADGSLSAISYGSTGGSAAVAEGTQGVLDAATETSAERAARNNAQADEIASQTRLKLCIAKPDECVVAE